jgi:hypothetical protein
MEALGTWADGAVASHLQDIKIFETKNLNAKFV